MGINVLQQVKQQGIPLLALPDSMGGKREKKYGAVSVQRKHLTGGFLKTLTSPVPIMRLITKKKSIT